MAPEHSDTVAVAATKAVPPVTVSLATIMGMQVSELVLWATLIYTVLLIAKTAYQFYQAIKASRKVVPYVSE
jgi:hypothetical protein